MTIDLGTGDGRFALARAREHPDELVLAFDANAAAMRDASRRSPSNAIFLADALEALPAAPDGIASLLTVHFPWGSLRRAATGEDPVLTRRIASLLAPAGAARLLLASAPRDPASAVEPDAVAAAWQGAGVTLREARPALLADAEAAHSSWGKRLLRNPSAGRTAWLMTFERSPSPRHPPPVESPP